MVHLFKSIGFHFLLLLSVTVCAYSVGMSLIFTITGMLVSDIGFMIGYYATAIISTIGFIYCLRHADEFPLRVSS